MVAAAISAGIFNDLGSGSNVDVCIITKDNTEMLRNYEMPVRCAVISSLLFSLSLCFESLSSGPISRSLLTALLLFCPPPFFFFGMSLRMSAASRNFPISSHGAQPLGRRRTSGASLSRRTSSLIPSVSRAVRSRPSGPRVRWRSMSGLRPRRGPLSLPVIG